MRLVPKPGRDEAMSLVKAIVRDRRTLRYLLEDSDSEADDEADDVTTDAGGVSEDGTDGKERSESPGDREVGTEGAESEDEVKVEGTDEEGKGHGEEGSGEESGEGDEVEEADGGEANELEGEGEQDEEEDGGEEDEEEDGGEEDELEGNEASRDEYVGKRDRKARSRSHNNANTKRLRDEAKEDMERVEAGEPGPRGASSNNNPTSFLSDTILSDPRIPSSLCTLQERANTLYHSKVWVRKVCGVYRLSAKGGVRQVAESHALRREAPHQAAAQTTGEHKGRSRPSR